jgi:hypothetical protein
MNDVISPFSFSGDFISLKCMQNQVFFFLFIFNKRFERNDLRFPTSNKFYFRSKDFIEEQHHLLLGWLWKDLSFSAFIPRQNSTFRCA